MCVLIFPHLSCVCPPFLLLLSDHSQIKSLKIRFWIGSWIESWIGSQSMKAFAMVRRLLKIYAKGQDLIILKTLMSARRATSVTMSCLSQRCSYQISIWCQIIWWDNDWGHNWRYCCYIKTDCKTVSYDASNLFVTIIYIMRLSKNRYLPVSCL